MAYKITVADFYVTDGCESNPPQKFHLPWHKSKLLRSSSMAVQALVV